MDRGQICICIRNTLVVHGFIYPGSKNYPPSLSLLRKLESFPSSQRLFLSTKRLRNPEDFHVGQVFSLSQIDPHSCRVVIFPDVNTIISLEVS